MLLGLEEINEVITSVQYLPEQWWAAYMSPGTYNECYLYICYVLGEKEDAPKLKHLDTQKRTAVRKALSNFLLSKYD